MSCVFSLSSLIELRLSQEACSSFSGLVIVLSVRAVSLNWESVEGRLASLKQVAPSSSMVNVSYMFCNKRNGIVKQWFNKVGDSSWGIKLGAILL